MTHPTIGEPAEPVESAAPAEPQARPNRALVVVDVQNDFCERGSLAVPGGAAVAAAISVYLSGHARDYALVVATRDWHVDPGEHFAAPGQVPDLATTWPVHCVAGTAGAAFHRELRLPTRTVIVSKGERSAAYSGFEGHSTPGVPLAELVDRHACRRVDVCGLATSYCVRATALEAAARGYSTRVLSWLCADVPGADGAETLAALAEAGVDWAGERAGDDCTGGDRR